MRTSEMLWFDDVSPMNEPVLFFPVIGRISMRQFAMLGTSALASYWAFSAGHSPLAAIPACIGAVLALVRPRAGSAEWMAFSALLFIARKLGSWRPGGAGRLRVGRLGIPRTGRPSGTVAASPECRTRTVVVSDPSRPIIFRVKIKCGGSPVGCRSFKVGLGGAKTLSVSTDVNGSLEAVLIPETEGPKTISVEADGGIPVLSETIDVRACARPGA